MTLCSSIQCFDSTEFKRLEVLGCRRRRARRPAAATAAQNTPSRFKLDSEVPPGRNWPRGRAGPGRKNRTRPGPQAGPAAAGPVSRLIMFPVTVSHGARASATASDCGCQCAWPGPGASASAMITDVMRLHRGFTPGIAHYPSGLYMTRIYSPGPPQPNHRGILYYPQAERPLHSGGSSVLTVATSIWGPGPGREARIMLIITLKIDDLKTTRDQNE